MESLVRKIQTDVEAALKGKDSLRLETLRMLRAALHNKEIENRGKGLPGQGKEVVLRDDEAVECVRKEVKKRKEAADLYKKGGRSDLAEKEEREIEVLRVYLPKEMEESEVKRVVERVLAQIPQGETNFGKIMGEVMKELKGKADAGMISAVLKNALQGK